MEHKIVYSTSIRGLNSTVSDMIKEGWFPVGGHQAVLIHQTLRYSGSQHKDTVSDIEYSQSMQRNAIPSADDETPPDSNR